MCVAIESGEPHHPAEHERQQHVQHQRAEPTRRNRVTSDGVHAVGDAGGEGGPAPTHQPPCESVRAEGAQRHRRDDDDRARQPDRPEEHGSERAHQGKQEGRGRRRPETRVSPRRSEGVEEVTAARPWHERADSGYPTSDHLARAHEHDDDEPEERQRGGPAHAIRHSVDREATSIAERTQPFVGVQVVSEEGTEPRRASDLQLSEFAVAHVPERLGTLARWRAGGEDGRGSRTIP